MKLLLVIILLLFISNKVFTTENKIILKIENEIITSIDLENERNYLIALNPNIKNLSNNRLNLISKNSLIKERIKYGEILKYTKTIELDEQFLNTLIKQRYSRLNLSNKDEFMNYLKNFNIDIETIKKKISIEALWNQLIYQKFYKNVKIDKDKLKEQILIKNKNDQTNFLLSEIVFRIEKKKDLKKKYSQILKDIRTNGFESAALTHSISDSASIGGKLGWINLNSLNKKIKKEISNLNKKEISKPIFTPNGYLVLKIDDIKFINTKFNKDAELKELIKIKTNEQLNQQSIIYFNKIKKNTNINEL